MGIHEHLGYIHSDIAMKALKGSWQSAVKVIAGRVEDCHTEATRAPLLSHVFDASSHLVWTHSSTEWQIILEPYFVVSQFSYKHFVQKYSQDQAWF